MTSCDDHRLGEGNRCIFCGYQVYPELPAAVFAKTVEPRNPFLDRRIPGERRQLEELEARWAGPPKDGHDYTWIRHTRTSDYGTGTAVSHSYSWKRNDVTKRERRNEWSIAIIVLVIMIAGFAWIRHEQANQPAEPVGISDRYDRYGHPRPDGIDDRYNDPADTVVDR